MNDAKADPMVFKVFTEIGIIEQLARTHLERQLPDGLKLSHFGVLNHFARRGGTQSPASLASAFQVTKGAMTNTIQRLEARGLIDVRGNPRDGRAKLVSLTPAGSQARREAVAAVAPLVAELEKTFSTEEFSAALPFLQRLRIYLDEARDP